MRILIAAVLATGLLGCTARAPSPTAETGPALTREALCDAHFRLLDELVDRSGVRDAEDMPVAGTPYLRASRLLASYRDEVDTPAMRAAWLERMRTLDQQARRYEIANVGSHLSAEVLGYVGDTPLPYLLDHLDHCGRRLLARDLADDARFEALRAAVPGWQRAAEDRARLRPITNEVGNGLGRSLMDALERPPPLAGSALTLVPEGRLRGPDWIAALLSSRRQDALGLPVLTDSVAERLLEEFAPVIEIAPAEDESEVPMRVVLSGSQQAPRPATDPQTPALYGRVGLSRDADESFVQIVYSAWFSREGGRPPDALYLRVSVDGRGRPFRVEVMPGGGRERLLLPVGIDSRGVRPDRAILALPPALSGQRLRMRFEHGAFAGIDYVESSVEGTPYTIIPEAILRSLPVDGDPRRRASLYTADGRMRGAGAQVRQWGHHALDDARAAAGPGYFDAPEHRLPAAAFAPVGR